MPQSWGTPNISKSINCVGLIPFSGIRILVYSSVGCATSKIYLWLEDNRSSFSRVNLKSKTKDARVHNSINSCSVLFCLRKTWFSENKNLTSNNLKMNHFMFNVKQLKMNESIKYIWQLIISISNATLEVPSLHPWIIKKVRKADTCNS